MKNVEVISALEDNVPVWSLHGEGGDGGSVRMDNAPFGGIGWTTFGKTVCVTCSLLSSEEGPEQMDTETHV